MTTNEAARAVPVFVERGAQRRVMGATDWWFYPLILATAAVLVALSLGVAVLAQAPAAQTGVRSGGALSYGAQALANGIAVDDFHVRHDVRDIGLRARALRLAVQPGAPAPETGDRAPALLLTTADTAALVGRPVRVEIAHRRFSVTAAGGLALRFDDGPWTTVALPEQSGAVTAVLPAPTTAPRALGIRLITDKSDMNYGAEFTRITLRPVP